MIKTVQYHFTPHTGEPVSAFEGYNEEADAALNAALEEGYREVMREIIPPAPERHNYLVVVKLWKSDKVMQLVGGVQPGLNFAAFADEMIKQIRGVDCAGGVEPVDNAPSLTHTWTTGNSADDAPDEDPTPVATPRIVRKVQPKVTPAKTKTRTPRKSK